MTVHFCLSLSLSAVSLSAVSLCVSRICALYHHTNVLNLNLNKKDLNLLYDCKRYASLLTLKCMANKSRHEKNKSRHDKNKSRHDKNKSRHEKNKSRLDEKKVRHNHYIYKYNTQHKNKLELKNHD